jgi:transcription-repair coupling factor (superfamily II helicase)
MLAIEDAYVALKNMPGSKSKFFFKLEEALELLKGQQQVFCAAHKIEELSELKGNQFEFLSHTFEAKRCFHHFRKVHDAYDLDLFTPEKNLKLYFLNANQTEEDEVKKKFADVKMPAETHYEKGYLTSGFVLADIPLAVIPNPEITNRNRIRRQKWRNTYHTPASDFHQLEVGDTVVHYHSGIGRYLGVEKQKNLQGVEAEFLAIQYAETSKLYVPLSQSYLVSRYIGSTEEPPQLSQLGSKRWQTARMTAQAQIIGYANDLLQIYANRAAHGGFQYGVDSDLTNQFAGDFPYQETQDQILAIQAIKEDMMSAKAMDRMICGDVGYGKTEVAMRAAFKAVADGQKQVAVLVPTTVLAMQHYETFSQRMSGFPIKVDVASRFRKPKEVKATLEAVEKGKVDILIGTHRLLSKDVRFKELGLIIIDEEQRFGVRSKEHLKKMKVGVDCLTLSATPIPRSLYMSLVGARDMSVISTPPQDRLPVKTIIAETDNEIIANALMRELARGGQAFYIHNRVETIHSKASMIQKLVPSARIGVVHGQMDPEDIDPIFHQFKEGNLDILFATTIVENGIDIPNANTILIERADTFGLADLYQLRGRVGRWNRAAYAYFLIPKNIPLAEVTQKRLHALAEASGYGGGMKIAMRDLEIRGAGDILGVQQSGQVSAIGFHLYCKLLKKTIESIKKHQTITFEETKLEFPFDARLPESYINEVSLRMELYHRLGEASTYQEADDLLAEMKDRFGVPPLPVLWLYHMTRIRVFASLNHFTLLRISNNTFLAERQKGKDIERKTAPIPRKFDSPLDMETSVIEYLKKNFNCPKNP